MSAIPVPVPGTCWGCVHRAQRFKARQSVIWCAKWHAPTPQRCADYRHQGKANALALRFYASARPR